MEKPEKKDCMPKCEAEKAGCAKMEKPKDMEFEKFMYTCVQKAAMKQPKGECMMCMKEMMPEKPDKEPVVFSFKVSMVMDKECKALYPKEKTGGLYIDNVPVTRRSNECTTNVLGSSVIFECMGGYINEHVFIDATQGDAPEEPDCSGKLLYTMPIKNGCNNYDWGNMHMVWEDFCTAEKKPMGCQEACGEESMMCKTKMLKMMVGQKVKMGDGKQVEPKAFMEMCTKEA